MTVQPDAPTGFGGLRDLPLTALYAEFDRLEHLLAVRSSQPSSVGGRDFATPALRQRERAVVAEIRRRPGGVQPERGPFSAVAPPG